MNVRHVSRIGFFHKPPFLKLGVFLCSAFLLMGNAEAVTPAQTAPAQANQTTVPRRLGVRLPALPSLTNADPYLPDAELLPTHLLLRLGERRVYVYSNDVVMAAYPVAIGRANTPTPTGEFQVFEMVENPVWQSPWTGAVGDPGPDSALGLRWIGFAHMPNGVIGFHGTPTVSSIGQAASNGCVRLRNEHVLQLFQYAQIGMRVVVEP
ncbi:MULTISPECIES: L,D-transpeptidase [unclassified Leptolyngbya]|uniref:L,D-transpeptidase n=1 Tax=unclassified Leptolyngbya TaxID=2650499 RepID=UPI001687211F|nr:MULTISPECIES: L,D-transpeptidase [unclassified Leptolyngbya]MBD1910655.1 L,D-transpeptidase [Leptolyngbya sp. FACHB-8]MBD2157169.1 L,D-transpeptidase [Leptolyngbya sp. FACHB-16]